MNKLSARAATKEMHEEDTANRFRPVRWFSIASLLFIGMTTLASSWILSNYMQDTLLQRDAALASEFVNGIVRSQNASTYFEGETYNPDAPGLEAFFLHVANMPNVMRANVYASDRSILWSSDRSLIGKRFEGNDELEHAFLGQLASDIEVFERGEKEEHVDLEQRGERFVENYLPIWNASNTNVVGVIEMYRSPEPLFKSIDRVINTIWSISLIAAPLLFFGLNWVVHRANTLIDREHHRRVDAERMVVIGEMASSVAHGIRNPLASIRSSAELAACGDLPKNTTTLLNQIVEQSDRLEGWIKGFLNQSILPDTTTHSGSLLQTCLSEFEEQFRLNDILTETAISVDLPAVTGNSSNLRQAFNTILSNSIEAMRSGGTLKISGGPVDGCRAVAFDFFDNGPGFDESIVASGPKPFWTTKAKGMGVGLLLSKRLIERSGGSLEIGNHPSGGALVRLVLPVDELRETI